MPGYARTPFFGFQAVFKEQPPIAAFVSTDTVQSIPGGLVPTVVTFATPLLQDPLNLDAQASLWDASAPDRFTIRVRGFYLFGASLEFDILNASRAGIFMTLNGTGIAAQEVQRTGGADRAVVALTTMYPCLAGDVIQLQALQSSAGAINTLITGNTPNMWIVRIG